MGCHGVFVLCCKYKETLSIQPSALSPSLLFTNSPCMPNPTQISWYSLVTIYLALFLMGGEMLSLLLFSSVERLHSATKFLPCPTFQLRNLQLSLLFLENTKNHLNTCIWNLYPSDLPHQTFLSEFSEGRLQTHIATSLVLWLDSGFLPSGEYSFLSVGQRVSVCEKANTHSVLGRCRGFV